MFTKFLRKPKEPNTWYIIIYWTLGHPKRYALTKENENTLLIFRKESEGEKLAKTLQEGSHDFQKRPGQYSNLKGMEYKVVKIEL